MYHVFYLYRVSSARSEQFLRIVNDAGAVYREHGVVASITMRVTEAAAKYGCLGLSDALGGNVD